VSHKLEQFYPSNCLNQVNKKLLSALIWESEAILPPFHGGQTCVDVSLAIAIAVPIQMRYNVISQGVGARHAVPLRVYLT